jgi:SET domain-containing protein 6
MVEKGDEVYNTYGEHSNQDLLHMYGFVEDYPNNVYDNVEIPTNVLVHTIKSLKNDSEPLLEEKIELFHKLNLIDENVSFVVDANGILNEEEVSELLQVCLQFIFDN